MQRFFRFSLVVTLQLTLWSVLGAGELRVATYNLNNYLVMDRHVAGHWRPSYPKPESEKAIIRQIIGDSSPDILVLQELGSPEFLEELRADLALEGSPYEYAVHMKGVDPVRHLAVLSKSAPQEVVHHTNLDFKYFEERKRVKRGMLEMSFDLGDDQSFQLFAVHLKSRYTNKKEDVESALRRVREAEACRNRVVERTLDKGRENYLIVGDFNDHPVSAPLRRFYSRGNLHIGTLVPAADTRDEVWTYYYKKEARYEAVDGFVASASMRLRIENGRGHIVDRPGALAGSDHRMVYLDLKY